MAHIKVFSYKRTGELLRDDAPYSIRTIERMASHRKPHTFSAKWGLTRDSSRCKILLSDNDRHKGGDVRDR